VKGYRSIRDLRLALGKVTVILGANGCGKTNLYRALYILGAAARGRLARTIADEGGMPSALWAGARKKGVVRMAVDVRFDDFGYHLACGLPVLGTKGRFHLDPEVKEEELRFWQQGRPATLLERANATAWLRDADGARISYPITLRDSESVLAQIQDPQRFPVLANVRQEIASWRFYHHFRTDQDSPLRHPQVSIQTPVLSDGGGDLAAALQTIYEIGDGRALAEELVRAFPRAELSIVGEEARLAVALSMPGVLRPLQAPELSDGTLRYLCLLAALLSPRPPTFLALNEPETSLHPDLMLPLAHLVARAARSSQILITTHATALAEAIAHLTGSDPIRLTKVAGETREEKAAEPTDEEEDSP